MKAKLAIALALALASGAAWSADSGFYIGAGLGFSDASASSSWKAKSWKDGVVVYSDSEHFDFSGSDFGWNIYVGYDFNKYAAVELGYMDLGKPKDTVDKGYDDYYGINYKTDVELTLKGIDLAVVGKVPLGESFDLHAKLGVFWWTPEELWTHKDVWDSGSVDKYQERGEFDSTDLLVGVGATYKLNENILFGLDWTHIEVSWGGSDSDSAPIDTTDYYSLSATYKF